MLLFVLVGYGAACNDMRHSSRFDSRLAAEADGFFERGWLPDVLPNEAGPIEEVHDLDTNGRCSRSDFPTQHRKDIERALRAIGFNHYAMPLPEPPFRNCPFSLAEASRSEVFLAKATSLGTEFAAIDKDGVLFFWSSGS